MRYLATVLLASALLLLAGAQAAWAQRGPGVGTVVPQIVEIEGCILPANGCEEQALEVLDIVVDGQSQRLGVLEIRVVTGKRIGGSILGDLHARVVHVYGPEKLLDQLTPGSRLQLRAGLRTGSQILHLQTVEPLSPRDAADDDE